MMFQLTGKVQMKSLTIVLLVMFYAWESDLT